MNFYFGDCLQVRVAAAREWTKWEKLTSKLFVDWAGADEDDKYCEAFARIENHYFVNKGFFPSEDFLITEAKARLGHIPCVIVQGRCVRSHRRVLARLITLLCIYVLV